MPRAGPGRVLRRVGAEPEHLSLGSRLRACPRAVKPKSGVCVWSRQDSDADHSDCVLGSAATPTEGRGRPGHLAGASLVVPKRPVARSHLLSTRTPRPAAASGIGWSRGDADRHPVAPSAGARRRRRGLLGFDMLCFPVLIRYWSRSPRWSSPATQVMSLGDFAT
jgi:hypothetical protein